MLPPTRMPHKSTQSANLPSLPAIDPVSSQSKSSTSIPTKRIHSDQQLQKWINSDSHSIYLLFIARLANASVNKSTFLGGKGKAKMRQSTLKLLDLLDTFKRWTQEIEPLKTPQRFGNLAFRDWGKRLEEVSIVRMHTFRGGEGDHLSFGWMYAFDFSTDCKDHAKGFSFECPKMSSRLENVISLTSLSISNSPLIYLSPSSRSKFIIYISNYYLQLFIPTFQN